MGKLISILFCVVILFSCYGCSDNGKENIQGKDDINIVLPVDSNENQGEIITPKDETEKDGETEQKNENEENTDTSENSGDEYESPIIPWN